jgi:hypothetical protein
MDLDDQVAAALGISTFGAGLIIAAILVFMFLLPLGYLYSGKNKNPMLPCVIVGNALLGFCVYMTWFPVWLFAIEIALTAALWSLRAKDMI